MHSVKWTHKDEERSIEYHALLVYQIDEGNLQIRNTFLWSVTDWSYSKQWGVDIEFPDDEQIVTQWLLQQIRDCETVRESAEEACRKDYEEHLELLKEESQGVI